MKRKNIALIHDRNNIPLDKKVKIVSLMEQSLQNIYQNSTEFNSVMSFSDYVNYFNYFLTYRNSELFYNLPIDILLQINNYLKLKEKLTMIYVCKNWFEKFYNNDYFWKYLLSLCKIENNFDTNQIRNFLILKYKYYNHFKNQKRKSMECSSEDSILESLDEGTILIKFKENIYFNGTFINHSGWSSLRGGSTIKNFRSDLFGIYFEPLSLQYIFLKLEINIDYYDSDEYEKDENPEFYLIAYLQNEQQLNSDLCDKKVNQKEKKEKTTFSKLEIIKMGVNKEFIINYEALRKLVREWLKLSENNVKNEKEWLKELFENKIPKEAKCKEIFEQLMAFV